MQSSHFIADHVFVWLSGQRTVFAVSQILNILHAEYFRVGADYGRWLDP